MTNIMQTGMSNLNSINQLHYRIYMLYHTYLNQSITLSYIYAISYISPASIYSGTYYDPVCLSEISVLPKAQHIELVLTHRLSSINPMLCYKEMWVTSLIKV